MENQEKKTNVIPIIVSVLVILAVGAYFVYGRNNKMNEKANPVEAKVESAATVNGSVISKETYATQLAASVASYKAKGVDVADATKLSAIKAGVLDNLINNELLIQGVIASGIKASPEDVEKQFQAVLTQAGGADKLKEELARNNTTEAQLRENISKQLAVQAYLLQNIDVKSITVSDAEIAQFYADYSKAQIASGQKTVPARKDLEVQIKQQIIFNKQQTLIVDFIASLRAKAKIETTI